MDDLDSEQQMGLTLLSGTVILSTAMPVPGGDT